MYLLDEVLVNTELVMQQRRELCKVSVPLPSIRVYYLTLDLQVGYYSHSAAKL